MTSESKELVAVNNSIIDTCTELQRIVDDELSVVSNNVDGIKYNLQIFLISQARKELQRAIKLTNTLDKISDFYQERALQYIGEHGDEDNSLLAAQGFIETISKCVDRSFNMVKQVLADERLFTVTIDVTEAKKKEANTTKDSELLEGLRDPRSRQKIIELLRATSNALADKAGEPAEDDTAES